METRFYEFSIGSLSVARLHSGFRSGRTFTLYSESKEYPEKVMRRYYRMFAKQAAQSIPKGSMSWSNNAGWYKKPEMILVSTGMYESGVIKCENSRIEVKETIEPLCFD
jgi:hypothetical protein